MSKSSVIVIAVKNSKVTDKVVQYALKHFGGRGYEFHLVNVVTPIHQLNAMPASGAAAGLARASPSTLTPQEQVLCAQRFLIEEVAPKMGMSNNAVKSMVLQSASGGSEAIGAAIDDYARDVGAMMVLMTRHAKPLLQEMFTGSVTVSCVKKCTVPLTIVH